MESYLLSVHNVHNDASLEHAGQASLDGEVVLAVLSDISICGGECSCHVACRVEIQ